MCGILGLFSKDLSFDLKRKINEAWEVMDHRGPDDRGIDIFNIQYGQLALGHLRLSIIDLSIGGHQPKHTPDGRYTIVFNGEIYNYKELRKQLIDIGISFLTDSDTEVLLAAWAQWGASCLRQLVGMFAFAVFDRNENSLTLVRDAFGIKPLFYSFEQEQLSFASETQALLKLRHNKPKINVQRGYDYLVYGSYDNGEDTFYDEVRHLLPGHLITINLSSYQIGTPNRWWWPSIKERNDLSFEEAAIKLREMFLANVKLHLRSDVPVGAALSGGLDSSAVVCAMRYLEPTMPIHTFTYVAKGSSVDEEVWADMINEYIKAIPHKVIVNPNELIVDLDDMICVQGEPFGGTSIYAQYRIFKAAREEGIIVTLDGQGADELLAGYNGYPQGYLHSLLERGKILESIKFLRAWCKWPGRKLSHAIKMFGSVITPNIFRAFAYKIIRRDPRPVWLNSKYLIENNIQAIPPRFIYISNEGKRRRLVEQLRSSLVGYGLAQLLRHGDRNSMRWSIESRVPFLTIEMAEFLLSLPEDYLLSEDGQTKSIFRAAMRGIVPDSILDRRDKIGFQTPEQQWLLQIREQVIEWVRIAQDVPFLNIDEIMHELDLVFDGKKRFSQQVWRLINYCRWISVNKF